MEEEWRLMDTVLNLDFHYPCDLRGEEICRNQGLVHSYYDSWPHEPGIVLGDISNRIVASDIHKNLQLAVWSYDDGIAKITVQDGVVHVRGAASSRAGSIEIAEDVKRQIPPREDAENGIVAVNFWSATQNGGRNIRRDIDVPTWASIEDNYPRNEGLSDTLSPDFRPGKGGQLILWHGEPGTGKTTALRALAHEWREWCSLHYIVDPEVFFGNRADYMMEVITAEESSDPGPHKPSNKWRLLLLEDCGEMLQPDAKSQVGQGLSRLLNACDGLLGRGLRLLVLVTTNEPIEKLHEAVDRPGRCAARIEFPRFTSLEAREWLQVHDLDDTGSYPQPTLADLYGELEGFGSTRLTTKHKVGFGA